MTFADHISSVRKTVQQRVNLLKKLVCTTWGASFNTMKLSTTALALSTAVYACPVWAHSTHTKKLDIVINQAFRLISGAIKSTPTSMLPVVSGIAPPTLRRNYQILQLHQKSLEPRSLVPHIEADTAPSRLNPECL